MEKSFYYKPLYGLLKKNVFVHKRYLFSHWRPFLVSFDTRRAQIYNSYKSIRYRNVVYVLV